MNTATGPLYKRTTLVVGRMGGRVGGSFVAWTQLVRDQMPDGARIIEPIPGGVEVRRRRTEQEEPVPALRPKLSRIEIAVALVRQDTTRLVELVVPR